LPEVIVIEDFLYGSTGQAVFDLGQINGIVRYRLHEIGFSEKNGNFMKVTPGQAKKAACGKGNAEKVVVMMGVMKQTKVDWVEEFGGSAEHICDAISLILFLKERRKALVTSGKGEVNF
jgi:Holliday junction resolvasome RuvABC endonuclease subunit